MKRHLLVGIVMTVAVIALGGVLLAVTFGQPDGTAHPYVGTLLFKSGADWYSCSGTLVAPRVMVTAGHCTVENGIVNEVTFVKFDPVISFPGRDHYASRLDYLEAKKNGWIQATVVPHPSYNALTLENDIGVVLLQSNAPVSVFGSLPPENFLNTIRSKDNRFTVVGYGMQGYIKPFYEDTWERYSGDVKLIELNSTFSGATHAKFSNNPGNTSGGSCYGDSGGPVFYSNSNMLTAVVSWGITPCIGVDYQTRVDTASSLNFVRQYLP